MSITPSVGTKIVTDCALLKRFCNGNADQARSLYANIHKRAVGYVVMLLIEADQWVAFGPSPGKCYVVKIVGTNNYAELMNSEKMKKYKHSCLLLHSVENPGLWARYLMMELERQVGRSQKDPAFIELGVSKCISCTPDQLVNIMTFTVNFLKPESREAYVPIHKRWHLRKIENIDQEQVD